MPDTMMEQASGSALRAAGARAEPKTLTPYGTYLRAIADTFERQDRTIGRPYSLSELRGALNALSNDALREMQIIRGDVL